MENAKISNLYDLNETIAKEYLEQFTYPWEALKGISEFIKKLGPTLDPEKFENFIKKIKNYAEKSGITFNFVRYASKDSLNTHYQQIDNNTHKITTKTFVS